MLNVLMTFVHIRNISAVIDTIWTKLERQGEGNVKAMSRQGQGNVKARPRHGQNKVKTRSGQVYGKLERSCKVKARSRQGQGEVQVR